MKKPAVLFGILFMLVSGFTSCRETARDVDDVEMTDDAMHMEDDAMHMEEDLEGTEEEIEEEF